MADMYIGADSNLVKMVINLEDGNEVTLSWDSEGAKRIIETLLDALQFSLKPPDIIDMEPQGIVLTDADTTSSGPIASNLDV